MLRATVLRLARDPYSLLGISRGASASEIKQAYYELARKHHPDKQGGANADDAYFKEVSAAFTECMDRANNPSKYARPEQPRYRPGNVDPRQYARPDPAEERRREAEERAAWGQSFVRNVAGVLAGLFILAKLNPLAKPEAVELAATAPHPALVASIPQFARKESLTIAEKESLMKQVKNAFEKAPARQKEIMVANDVELPVQGVGRFVCRTGQFVLSKEAERHFVEAAARARERPRTRWKPCVTRRELEDKVDAEHRIADLEAEVTLLKAQLQRREEAG